MFEKASSAKNSCHGPLVCETGPYFENVPTGNIKKNVLQVDRCGLTRNSNSLIFLAVFNTYANGFSYGRMENAFRSPRIDQGLKFFSWWRMLSGI